MFENSTKLKECVDCSAKYYGTHNAKYCLDCKVIRMTKSGRAKQERLYGNKVH